MRPGEVGYRGEPAKSGQLISISGSSLRGSPSRLWRGDGTLSDAFIAPAIVGLFLIASIVALEWAAFFMVPVTTAIVVGMTLGPLIDKLERAGLPPYLAGVAILAAVCLFIYALFFAFAIPLEEWSARFPEVLVRLREVAFWVADPIQRISEISREVQEAANAGEQGLEVSVRNQGVVTGLLASAPGILAQILIFIGTFYFFAVSRSRVRAGILTLASTRAGGLRLAKILRDTEYSLSRYLLAIAMVNFGLGVLTGIVMWALGVPSPALWGALAAVLNFIMFLGPALMIAILTGVSLITFDTLSAILLPPASFLALNILESQFITPSVLGQRLVLNPLIVFLSLAFWLWLWGPVGAFLAVPIFVMVSIALYHSLPPGKREPFSLGIR